MNWFGRVVLCAGSLAVVCVGSAEAQLASELSHWLQPLPSCRTINCIIKNIPTSPPPGRPGRFPWRPSGTNGPITTTPEPVTMALLGTGLIGIGLAARRRKVEKGELV